ncbi:RNA polymerase sigma factor [Algoriphagus chordae]|uniref:RNA polymerase sigma-70 factor (ECF subfamily) n=1 Tax=Algoriphagus chordae TaxID=237019 RepID=A0A2W7QVX7_9BACT|nr:sigma-70 family RNA polymerase sigma factor [Algoriphagus chordae]PZX52683.1 RNA polymerase sigma-70 factor (ECF subfamily) [Algoriphagus chordae]
MNNSFESIYKNNYEDLLKYGRNFLKNEQEAFDILQEIFLKIYQKDKFKNILHIKPYLFKAYRNGIIDFINASKNHESLEVLDQVYYSKESFEDELIANERFESQSADLRNAIAKLSARQKEILYLKYYRGLKNEEISQILGINTQSVKNSLFKSVSNLKDDLGSSYILLPFLLSHTISTQLVN